MSDIIVGLDIGTSNVRVVIAELNELGKLQVIGVGKSLSTGLRSGLVVNIDATMKAIEKAVEDAEMMAGCEVKSVFISLGGSQIESQNSKGFVAVAQKAKDSREITEDDIARVIQASQAIAIPLDREILHVIPQEYIIDGSQRTKEPLNMIGVRLESEVHIITASVSPMQNIIKCVKRAGYDIDGIMLKTLAATESVMTEEEKDLGSILIDLGGGTTDVLVVLGGAPICTATIPIGGIFVTSDISTVRGVSIETAETIKLSDGCCWEGLLSDDEYFLIPGVGGRPPEQVSRKELCEIMQPRVEEILTMVKEKVYQLTKLKKLSGNVVLTGAGALMPGIIELAQDVFDTASVRIGTSANLGNVIDAYRSADFATATGLLVAFKDRLEVKSQGQGNSIPVAQKNSVLKSIGSFFKEFF